MRPVTLPSFETIRENMIPECSDGFWRLTPLAQNGPAPVAAENQRLVVSGSFHRKLHSLLRTITEKWVICNNE